MEICFEVFGGDEDVPFLEFGEVIAGAISADGGFGFGDDGGDKFTGFEGEANGFGSAKESEIGQEQGEAGRAGAVP